MINKCGSILVIRSWRLKVDSMIDPEQYHGAFRQSESHPP